MKIEGVPTKEVAPIVAGLVREGVTFTVYPTSVGLWCIELTGGY